MKLKITVASPEVEDFALELQIDADATFEDLHKIIQKGCGYMDFGTHRFYVCDEDWRPEHRIFQTDAGSRSDEDIYLMDETPLEEFLEDEGQRIAYRFDPESRRLLLLEVTETSFGGSVGEPKIRRRYGEAPMQMLMDDNFGEQPTTTPTPTDEEEEDESFYGDDGFEEDELDAEGFDVIE